jgi:hypothetical protein
MNIKLTEQIAYHVLSNLGVLPSNFVNRESTRSIVDKDFLLSEKITFNTEGGAVLRKNIYGCQVTVADSKELKILVANCTEDETLPEFCALVQLKDSPAFAIYLMFTHLSKEALDPEPLIAVSTDKKNWMPCSTYLQATFLAGMEQIRDLGFGWSKCTDYQDQYQQLLLFIKFHHSFYGVADEGQEDGS